jgi:hypothetical protein
MGVERLDQLVKSSTWSRIGCSIFRPSWRPWAAARRPFRYRMAAATRSPVWTAVRIRVSCHPKACARATSIFRTCTSTRSR